MSYTTDSVSRIDLEHRDTSPCWMNGHYGDSTVVTLDGIDYNLGVGTDDDWTLYSSPWGPVVVVRNYKLRYVGVSLLNPEWYETTKSGDSTYIMAMDVVFFQDTYPNQIGPKDTWDYSDRTIIRRVCEGFDY